MRPFVLFMPLLGLLATPCTSSPALNLRDILLDTCNGWAANTTIAFPGDQTFNSSTERWSIYKAPSYSAVVSPAVEQDVAKAVKLGRKHRIPFLATGGRHGYGTTLGGLQNGLAIDLRQLNAVRVDRSARTVTVGGGTRLEEVLGPVNAAGFEMRVVGVTVGGGVNLWQGVFGLLIDALVSVRLVTAEGRIIEVSERSNPNLFWGIRGAGANFGIITSATYRLNDQTNNDQLLLVSVGFPAEQSTSYFNMIESVVKTKPAELSFSSTIMWNRTSNAPQVVATWLYLGPREEGMELMAPLFALRPPVLGVQTISWRNFYTSSSFGNERLRCIPNSIHDPYAANVRNVSAPTLIRSFERLSSFYQQYPSARASGLTFENPSIDATTAVHEDATAYAWRDTTGYMFTLFSWSPGDQAAEQASITLGRTLRSDFADTSGYPGLRVYLNSAQGDETLEEIYGRHKLPRLASLKRTWDPDSVFRYHHAIPT
ncbi:hypothetical protein S40288_10224, partial [Stachybotrys chartarum IBT 40288]